jgi:hypothetical protein
MTELIEEQEELEESLDPLDEELSAVIKTDPLGRRTVVLDPDVVKNILFTERRIPASSPPQRPPQHQPVIPQAPKKPLDPALQKLKNNLKTMIFEVWNELE